jgi:hypothetical protein
MDAAQAFSLFVTRALVAQRASRYSGLSSTANGQRKLLGMLDHDFESAIRPRIKRGTVNRESKCFVFYAQKDFGFGKEFATVSDAYDQLCDRDGGWLIVASDGLSGIFRPEAHWDAEIEIVG